MAASGFAIGVSTPATVGGDTAAAAEKPSSSGNIGAGENRLGLYKNVGMAEERQEMRRSRILNEQKEKRYNYIHHIRHLTEDIWDELEKDDDELKEMDVDTKTKTVEKNKHKFYFPRKSKHQLMYSEWMKEKPSDFEENWMMLPVPKGKRNLVVASRGLTGSFSKSGMCVRKFLSCLPGGNKFKHKWNSEYTILDCIFSEQAKTFYVMDVMCWRNHPMYDAEAEFRFYWLHEKFQDCPEVMNFSRHNEFRFEPLPNYRCNNENLESFMHTTLNLPLDGLIFYHKRSQYIIGSTPLALWLRAHMMPEMLGVKVHQQYMNMTPPNYTDFATFIKNEEEKEEKARIKDEKRKAATDAKWRAAQPERRAKEAEAREKAGKGQGPQYIAHINQNFVRRGEVFPHTSVEAGTEAPAPGQWHVVGGDNDMDTEHEDSMQQAQWQPHQQQQQGYNYGQYFDPNAAHIIRPNFNFSGT